MGSVGTRNMSLIKVVSLGTVRMAVQVVASFLSVKVTSVFLGPSGMGLMGQLQGFIGMTLGIISVGVNTGMVRLTAEYGTDTERRYAVVSTVVRAILIVGGLASAMLLVGSSWIAEKLLKSVSYTPAIRLFGALYMAGLFGSLLLGLANGAKDYTATTLIGVGNIVATLALYALLAPIYGVMGGLFAAALTPLMSLLVGALVARGKPWLEFRAMASGFSKSELWRISSFLPLAVTGAIVMPMTQIFVRDTVATESGMAAVGYLQGVWRISDLSLGIFMGMFTLHFLPTFAEIKTTHEICREVGRGLLFVVGAVGLISVTIYLLRDFLIAAIFTHDFVPMRDLFGWQMLGNVLKMASWLLGTVLVARCSPLLSAAVELATGGVWLSLAYVLVPLKGAVGAVLSYTASYAIYLVIIGGVMFASTRRTKSNKA